jgi:membrane protein
MQYLKSLLLNSYKRFGDSDAYDLGAALAYFTIFSLVPFISIIVMIVGFFLDQKTALGQVIIFFQNTAGLGVANFIQQMIQSSNATSTSIFASVLAFLILIYAVTNLTSQLQNSLNRILDTSKKETSFWKSLEDRVMSFSIVLLLSFVLTAFFLVSTAVSFFETYANRIFHLSTLAVQSINLLLTFILIGSIAFIAFRYLPHEKKRISPIIVGSIITSILFLIGRFALSIYLAYTDPGTGYGAAGTLVVILLWIFYSAQILFFGACAVYAGNELKKQKSG